ncbi:pyruvate dehydrogenase (acetyl-transferring), homodimeric type [Litorivicinus sp.]|nr:pyruvate dehydrogenase (acetyl-transferring), homodimeric type [Litorivicinus sp.]
MANTPIKVDQDPVETQEWLQAYESVLLLEGPDRAAYLLNQLVARSGKEGSNIHIAMTTPYRNTIPLQAEARMPGDLFMERRIRSLIRWNALAMVIRANKSGDDLGGHIATYQSAATLYEVGFNYFWKGPDHPEGQDLLYIQGHASPGIYARSFLEGRLSKEQLDNFRREVDGGGLSSYPHPWLMPDYWQFPTVSMGLGPIQSIYQAHVMKYLLNRGLSNQPNRKVWAFLGDGEMDEPESLGAIGLAGRERLDNLVFVVNCNLQRLDGPVRGNGKIVQELEGSFRGAGWNVIKVLWGGQWDPLFAKDRNGLMQKAMDEVVDGELQNCKAKGGAYTREHFFGQSPELKDMVADMSDEDIFRLNRGGHDPRKVYAAYHAAANHTGQPTVILAQTVKGYGMGSSGESANPSHQVKKLDIESLKNFRDRFAIPVSDDSLEELPYFHPGPDSPEMKYLLERRESLGGFLPCRRVWKDPLGCPPIDAFKQQLKGTGDRKISTTMAFVRMLSTLVKDKTIGHRVVPIVPDEARTFGMEGMFKQLGIYTTEGQKYIPHDVDQVLSYHEDKAGQILEEGINEAGAFSAWMACATSYANHNHPLIPFYIYYSMFGHQRVGDLIWAAGDIQAKGFLLGATSGRTTLNGEGLQHQDGHSHLIASTVPNQCSYDPTYSYEVAVIVQHGLRQMYDENQNVFYYITLMNENYSHPDMPDGCQDHIIKGMYLLKPLAERRWPHQDCYWFIWISLCGLCHQLPLGPFFRSSQTPSA